MFHASLVSDLQNCAPLQNTAKRGNFDANEKDLPKTNKYDNIVRRKYDD